MEGKIPPNVIFTPSYKAFISLHYALCVSVCVCNLHCILIILQLVMLLVVTVFLLLTLIAYMIFARDQVFYKIIYFL